MSDTSKAKVAKALLQTLSSVGVKWIRFVITDVSNQIRSKVINITTREIEENPEIILRGAMITTWVNELASMDGIDYGTSAGSELMIPNLETLHVLPYHPSHAAMYCTNYSAPDKTELCSRAFLEKQINAARETGIYFTVGVEIEFKLMKGGTTLDDSADFLDQVVDMLKAQKNACLPLKLIYAESGSGQNKIVVRYSWNPMETADSIITIRRTIHAVANQHGYCATFKLESNFDTVGSSMHLHLSFSDTDHGENKLGGKSDSKYGLSDTGFNITMGVIKHLPALVAITRTYRTDSEECWGRELEDKKPAVRLCKDFSTQSPTNIELKVCDANANPYLSIGSLLAAALDGIKNPPNEFPHEKGTKLENDLEKCADNLAASNFFENAMGTALFKLFVAIKKRDATIIRINC